MFYTHFISQSVHMHERAVEEREGENVASPQVKNLLVFVGLFFQLV